jgi:hypothetical protein
MSRYVRAVRSPSLVGRPSLTQEATGMVWTDDEIELLRRLRQQGASAARAGVALKERRIT